MKKYIFKFLDSKDNLKTKIVVADSYYSLETDIRFFLKDKLVDIFKSDMVKSIEVQNE